MNIYTNIYTNIYYTRRRRMSVCVRVRVRVDGTNPYIIALTVTYLANHWQSCY
jgi:hypothetical protein